MEYNLQHVLGIDIGGSHITTALVDLATREIVSDSRQRIRVDSNGTFEDISMHGQQ